MKNQIIIVHQFQFIEAITYFGVSQIIPKQIGLQIIVIIGLCDNN